MQATQRLNKSELFACLTRCLESLDAKIGKRALRMCNFYNNNALLFGWKLNSQSTHSPVVCSGWVLWLAIRTRLFIFDQIDTPNASQCTPFYALPLDYHLPTGLVWIWTYWAWCLRWHFYCIQSANTGRHCEFRARMLSPPTPPSSNCFSLPNGQTLCKKQNVEWVAGFIT